MLPLDGYGDKGEPVVTSFTAFAGMDRTTFLKAVGDAMAALRAFSAFQDQHIGFLGRCPSLLHFAPLALSKQQSCIVVP